MYTTVGEYPFTLLATMLNKEQKVISCAKHSKLKKEYHHEGIQELLEKPLNKKEQRELEIEQKKPIIQKEHEFKQAKKITHENYFINVKEIELRNLAIIEALKDGYTQGEVARYLSLSTALISKIFRSNK